MYVKGLSLSLSLSLSIYVYIHIYIYVKKYIHTLTHTHTHTRMHIYIYIYKLWQNYTKILYAVLNKSWQQYPTKQPEYMDIGIASRIFSKLHVAFLCCSHLAFSLGISLKSMWCINTVVWTQPQLERNPVYILSDRSHFHIIDNLSIAVYSFTRHMLTSFSVDRMFLPKYDNWLIILTNPSARAEYETNRV